MTRTTLENAYPAWRIHHHKGAYTAIRTGPRPPHYPGRRTVLTSTTTTGLYYRLAAQEALYLRRTG